MKNQKTNLTYLFFGLGGEYVLNSIYNKMVDIGHNCIEIDYSKPECVFDILNTLKGKNIVFITSAHMFIINEYYKYLKTQPPYINLISPLEIIDYLKPVKKVFYTHDLMDGFRHYDALHFSLFDLWLSPLPLNAHGLRYSEVVDVGWIKKTEATPKYKKGDDIKFAHGVSEITYFQSKGDDFFYNKFKDVWKEGSVGVRLYPGYDMELSKVLVKNNIEILDCKKNIFVMINETPVIITNSVTGVNVEASLSGRMVINLLDGVYTESYLRSQIGGLPNVHILTIPDAVEMIKAIKKGDMDIDVGEDILKPFDMELAILKIIDK